MKTMITGVQPTGNFTLGNYLGAIKNFVKLHPSFASYIKNGSMTWQKFYEMFDLYGEDSSVWNEYLKVGNNNYGKI